jgi:anti-anti-sigma factor
MVNGDRPVEFAVHVEQTGRAYVVAPVGELDLDTVEDVRDVLEARPERCTQLVLDLRRLTFFDTSGMRLVVEAMQNAERNGHGLALVRGSSAVQRLFEVAGIEDRLPFVDDPRDALRQA